MVNANKQKGKSWENDVCKIMNQYFGGSWVRTFTSGAYTGMSNNWRTNVLSKSQLLNNTNDIVPPDEYPNACVECKFYKDFDFHHLFRKEGNTTLNGWINQVEISGIDMEKSFPMICMKFNRKGYYIVCWKDKINDLDYSQLNHCVYNFNNKQYVVFEMDMFVNTFVEELKKKFS